MSAIVERVAGAIANAWPDRDIPHENAVAMARAAIRALREPTEAMLEAGTTHGITAYRCTMTQLRHGDAEETWWAMIDAALKAP